MHAFHHAIIALKRNYQQSNMPSSCCAFFLRPKADLMTCILNKYNEVQPTDQQTLEVISTALHNPKNPNIYMFIQHIKQIINNTSNSTLTHIEQTVGAWLILMARKIVNWDQANTVLAKHIFSALHQANLFNSTNLQAIANLGSYANLDADCYFNPITYLSLQLTQLPEDTVLTQELFAQLLIENGKRCELVEQYGNKHQPSTGRMSPK
jgi:hypothetical protein